MSDQLAQSLPVSYPEGAFVAGLLHDMGRLLIVLSLPEEHERILKTYEDTGQSWVDCERTILGFTHSELSADALAVWNLPEAIQAAARDHHNPQAEPGGKIPLSRVVDAANQYVNSTGVSILDTRLTDNANPAVIESLGLRPERLESVLADFKTDFEAMAEFLRCVDATINSRGDVVHKTVRSRSDKPIGDVFEDKWTIVARRVIAEPTPLARPTKPRRMGIYEYDVVPTGKAGPVESTIMHPQATGR